VATAAHTSAIKPIIVRIGNFSTAGRRAALDENDLFRQPDSRSSAFIPLPGEMPFPMRGK
jgi:hypothetical protein